MITESAAHWRSENGKLQAVLGLWGKRVPDYMYFDICDIAYFHPPELSMLRKMFFRGREVQFGDIEMRVGNGHNILRIRNATSFHASFSIYELPCHLFQAGHSGTFSMLGLDKQSSFVSFKRHDWPIDIKKIHDARQSFLEAPLDLAVYDVGEVYKLPKELQYMLWAQFYPQQEFFPGRAKIISRSYKTGHVLVLENPDMICPYINIGVKSRSLVHMRGGSEDFFYHGYEM